MTDRNKTPEQIEDEIKSTQHLIDLRIEALQSALSPSRLLSQLLPGLTEADGGNLANGVARTVRENPIPAALVGAGMLWLIGSAASRANGSGGAHRQTGVSRHNSAGTTAERVGKGIRDVADAVTDGIDDTRRRAGELSEQAARNTRAAVRQTNEALSAVPHQMRTAAQSGIEWTKANPIPTGLMCVAVGAALASVLASARAGNDNAAQTAARRPDAAQRSAATKRAASGRSETPRNARRKSKSATAAMKSNAARARSRKPHTNTSRKRKAQSTPSASPT
jgi:hypothetical protein